MSEENRNNHRTRYESLCDLNLVSLWSQTGSDSSSITREEYLAATNQLVEEEQSNFINQTVLLGALATLALLCAVTWNRAPEIAQAVQEVGKNSVAQLVLSDY